MTMLLESLYRGREQVQRLTWSTNPILGCFTGSVGSAAKNLTVPYVYPSFCFPASKSTKVDFPAPLGPRIASIFPGWTDPVIRSRIYF
jgi:hypothetical protein